MGINNNQLVTRYYDLQAKNNKYFKAVEAYVYGRVDDLYAQLKTTFVDSVTFALDDAMAAGATSGVTLDPAEAEVATLNYVLKTIDSLGLWIQPLEESDPNTVVARLNFHNHSRYY